MAGPLLMLVGAVVGVFDAMAVKLIGQAVHPFEIVFFRNLFSLLALLTLLRGGDWKIDGGGQWSVHIWRAVLKLAALAAAFLALTMLPLATATAIAFTTPVLTALGAMLFLHEPPRLRRLVALALGFAGILVIARPGTDGLNWGVLLALGSALALAAVMLLLRVSSPRENGKRVVLLNLILSVPLSLAMALPFWSTPNAFAMTIMIVQGVGGLLAQLAVTRAMKQGEASLLVLVDFARLPFAAAIGVFLFHETIDPYLIVGAPIILMSLLIVASDRQRKTGPG